LQRLWIPYLGFVAMVTVVSYLLPNANKELVDTICRTF